MVMMGALAAIILSVDIRLRKIDKMIDTKERSLRINIQSVEDNTAKRMNAVINRLDDLINIKSELIKEYKSLSKFVHGHGSKHMHSFESSPDFKYEEKMLNIWGSHYRNTCRLSTILILVSNHDNWYESSQTERDIISNVLRDNDKTGIAKVLDDSKCFDKHL